MKEPDASRRASLVAVIRHDIEAVRSLETTLAELPESADYSARAAVAYSLHNIYCALENSFSQISRTFENHIVETDRWHRELMVKMYLEIPGVRPAVLHDRTRPLLNELRSFRHVFRHSYDFQLDVIRLNRLVQRWKLEGHQVLEALSEFCLWLEKQQGA